MTTVSRNGKKFGYINGLLLGLVFGLIFLAIGFAIQTNTYREQAKQNTVSSMPASTSTDKLSPAAAFATGRPTVLFYSPVQMCEIMYCFHPSILEGQLSQQYGDKLNFVEINVEAVPNESDENFALMAGFDNWDLYPAGQIADWLPPMEQTIFGMGLSSPIVVLIDEDGAVQYKGSQHLTAKSLAPTINEVLEN